MSEGIPYADIVILALVAGFILLRLRSVLGHGASDGEDLARRRQQASELEPVVQLQEKLQKPKIKEEEADTYLAALSDPTVLDGINAIKGKDPQFNTTQFLSGAKGAFEMVMEAYEKGDKQTLKMLMSDSLFKELSDAIDKRAADSRRTETTLVSVLPKNVTYATLIGNTAKIQVKFISEQIALVRDAAGAIVEGDASSVQQAEDEWLFERDVTAKNPNWKIIET